MANNSYSVWRMKRFSGKTETLEFLLFLNVPIIYVIIYSKLYKVIWNKGCSPFAVLLYYEVNIINGFKDESKTLGWVKVTFKVSMSSLDILFLEVILKSLPDKVIGVHIRLENYTDAPWCMMGYALISPLEVTDIVSWKCISYA